MASAMVKAAPPANADAFGRSRLEALGQRNGGALPRGVDLSAIVNRAAPR
jgi:putative acyl-CoA dehydrogenase